MPIPDRLVAALADRYRIERELGAGGMATVYLAADLKHERKVAIKVLKPELAAVLGAERFVQEIKTTAALSHPHILPLFDSGEAGGFLYYVMPYIQGETIRERLNRETQLGVDEAVRITREIADALDYAHRAGVIHRDIKPENILLHDGRPMVMDFGIALAVSAAAGGRMTETGLSLGTPHYMSPEQATADKAITGRSDIYSLASVCYEMLTGEPPHMGNSAQQIIMKIIAEPVQPATALRKAVPPHVSAALGHALEKLPADRFDSAKAFAEALADVHFAEGARVVAATPLKRRGAVLALGATSTLLALLALAGWLRKPPAVERPVTKFIIDAQAMVEDVDVSPDGGFVLFGLQQLGVMRYRALDHDTLVPLPFQVIPPRITRDGRSLVGVTIMGDLITAGLPAGAPQVLARPGVGASAIPGNDGFVYLGLAGGGLGRIPESGGAIDTLIADSPSDARHEPLDVLPDGQTLLITRYRGFEDSLALFNIAKRAATPLFPAHRVQSARYMPPGYLLYNDGNQLVARPFNARTQTLGEGTIPIASGPQRRQLAFGVGGTTLAYATRGGGTGMLVLSDRQGNRRVLPNLPAGDYNSPKVSPDGQQIAVMHFAPTGERDLSVYRLPAGPLTKVTHTGDVLLEGWIGGGERVAYTRTGKVGDVFWRRADGSGEEQLLLHRDRIGSPTFFSDGRQVLYRDRNQLKLATVGADAETDRSVPGIRGVELTVSPNGRWLAFTQRDAGTQLYVQTLADSGWRQQVSLRSALDPRWSQDGRSLYFLDGANLMEATLSFDDEVRVSSLRTLPFYDQTGATWDVFPDGNQFVMTRQTDESGTRSGEVTVIANFDVLLARLARMPR